MAKKRMRSVTQIILLAFIVHAHAKDSETNLDKLVDKLIDKLVEQDTSTTKNKGLLSPLKSLGGFLASKVPFFPKEKEEEKMAECCSEKQHEVVPVGKDVESASPEAKAVGHLAVAKAIFNLVKNIVGAGALSLPAA